MGSLAPPTALRRYGDAPSVVNIAVRFSAILAITLLLFGLAAPAAAAPRVLAFGDSLTAGLGLSPEQAFPARLQAQLAAQGIAAQVTNGGVSGDTTAGGLARLDWTLADHPDIVLLELGANDALRGIDPKLTYANLDKIMARLKAAGTSVVLMGMEAPANWGPDYQQEFDRAHCDERE